MTRLSIKGKALMISRPRLQVVQSEEIVAAIRKIQEHQPGLINDTMVVTSALIEYANALELQQPQQDKPNTSYTMIVTGTGSSTYDTDVFKYLIGNLNRIAGIFAHIDKSGDDFKDYISRGKKPTYTFVIKGQGSTDFEFMHIATSKGSFFPECLSLLVWDFITFSSHIRFNCIYSNRMNEGWRQDYCWSYVPSLDEMATLFFDGSSYQYLEIDWRGNASPYNNLAIDDTRYVDYSKILKGLKISSLEGGKYEIERLTQSGVTTLNRVLLSYRFRCRCESWEIEQQDLDLYELGCIFIQHFGTQSLFSPAKFLNAVSSNADLNMAKATVYVHKNKRIEVLPMSWKKSLFTCNIDDKKFCTILKNLSDDPNPFKLFDMAEYFPENLAAYKKKKK